MKILDNIFPTLTQNYLDHPFAVGKVLNLTDKRISIKPLSKIEGDQDLIQSKTISIAPKDTPKFIFILSCPMITQRKSRNILRRFLSDRIRRKSRR